MTASEPLLIEVRANPHPIPSLLIPPEIVFDLEATCPYCQAPSAAIRRHGTYERQDHPAQRYRCLQCQKTFNAAKLPVVRELMHQVAWRLVELVICEGHPVNSLAATLHVPEKTLRQLITAIRGYLAVNLEVLQHLPHEQNRPREANPGRFRTVFMDEGFIKVAGVSWYLVFGVDETGQPLFAELLPTRNAAAMKACLDQCEACLGGLDVVVSDGHVPTHAALRRWPHPIIHVQHIHSGSRKRIQIHEITPLPGKKRAQLVTLILHNASLKAGQESIVEVQQRTVQTPPLKAGPLRRAKKKFRIKPPPPPTEVINQVLTPPRQRPHARRQTRNKRGGKKWNFHLRMDSEGQGWEMVALEGKPEEKPAPPGIMERVLGILTITREVFGERSITSNRAETFNSVHDRRVRYQGRKTEIQAQRDLKAWQAAYFYPWGAQVLLRAQEFKVPLTIVRALLPWAMVGVELG